LPLSRTTSAARLIEAEAQIGPVDRDGDAILA